MTKTVISLFVLLLSFSLSSGEISSQLGVNYERLGNNLLPPRTSMSFLQSSLKAKRVKIYDADAEILDALRNMGIRVSIMLPNQLVINVSTNQTFLDEWVQSNVVPFHPETLIRYLNSLVPQVTKHGPTSSLQRKESHTP
ncbi:hypothetical protein GLYMA_03G085951v4 [Glycine max]|nr:hypothetical protein GLYMA_03G085951v4 [Glycine max]KAH1069138.1 hypothetical protein GYH30_006647 [Glycine max]